MYSFYVACLLLMEVVFKVNTCKNENDQTQETSRQCKGRWNLMRKKYLGERAHEHEELKVNGLFQ
jgi:hypothetical protein